MSRHIFLSYSKKDIDSVRQLYSKLTARGYDVWFDEESLLPGQVWEQEIRKAIKTSAVVLMCLSSNWVNEPGYVHKELKLALEVMQEMPEGRVHTIPVRLDNCVVPPSLERLHWVDLGAAQGLDRLQKAIALVVAPEAPAGAAAESKRGVDSFTEFLEEQITKGHVIYRDPWSEGNSEAELEFKRLLKGRWKQSLEHWDAKQFQSILDLWEPLLDNPFFKVNHDEWKDKPFFRAQIQGAKSLLFMSHVHLGTNGDWLGHMPRAFRTLQDVLEGPPYSMKGEASDRLAAGNARTQNLNYMQALEFAQEWLSGWGFTITLPPFGISAEESDAVKQRVAQRLAEINFLLRQEGQAGQ
jgi:hypothetical protein